MPTYVPDTVVGLDDRNDGQTIAHMTADEYGSPGERICIYFCIFIYIHNNNCYLSILSRQASTRDGIDGLLLNQLLYGEKTKEPQLPTSCLHENATNAHWDAP